MEKSQTKLLILIFTSLKRRPVQFVCLMALFFPSLCTLFFYFFPPWTHKYHIIIQKKIHVTTLFLSNWNRPAPKGRSMKCSSGEVERRRIHKFEGGKKFMCCLLPEHKKRSILNLNLFFSGIELSYQSIPRQSRVYYIKGNKKTYVCLSVENEKESCTNFIRTSYSTRKKTTYDFLFTLAKISFLFIEQKIFIELFKLANENNMENNICNVK